MSTYVKKHYELLQRRAKSQPIVLTDDEKKLNRLYFGRLCDYQKFKTKLLKAGWVVELRFFGENKEKPSHLLNRSNWEDMIAMEDVVIKPKRCRTEYHNVRPRLHQYLTPKELKQLESQLKGDNE